MPQASQPEPRRRGRRPARTNDQLRSDMLDKGVELLKSRGLSLGFDTVRLEDAIIAADAPRASAYRAWTDDDDGSPQSLFHDELAVRVLHEYARKSADRIETMFDTPDLLDMPSDLATVSDDERSLALWNIIRAGGNNNQTQLVDNPLWPLALALTGALGTQHDSPDGIDEAWIAGERSIADQFIELYQAVTSMFGFRLRSAYTWEQLDAAVSAAAQGMAIRRSLHQDIEPVSRPTGTDGALQDWSLFSICLEALFRQFLEPDPDAPYRTELRLE